MSNKTLQQLMQQALANKQQKANGKQSLKGSDSNGKMKSQLPKKPSMKGRRTGV